MVNAPLGSQQLVLEERPVAGRVVVPRVERVVEAQPPASRAGLPRTIGRQRLGRRHLVEGLLNVTETDGCAAASEAAASTIAVAKQMG
jgi:hypothetical protein